MSVSIEDLGPPETTCSIRGKDLSVFGVSALSFFYLLQRYPAARAIMEKRFQDITPESLMSVGPEIVIRIMAIGVTARDKYDDEKSYEVAVTKHMKTVAALPAGYQIKLLRVVLEATMPDGADPFISELNTIRTMFVGTNSTPETTELGTTSRLRSEDVLLRADPNVTAGTLRRVS